MEEILGLNEKNQCDNKAEHDGHYYETEITSSCTGRLDCGAWAHPAHKFTQTKNVWCGGICLCGLRSYTHGPGSHK